MKVFLNSLYDDGTRTLGILSVYDCLSKVFECKTLEPPWKENRVRVSCIPAGEYSLMARWSEKYGAHYEVIGVPHRSLILLHWGNFPEDTEGCGLTGESFADLDKDGRPDVTKSKQTFERLRKILGDKPAKLYVSGPGRKL